MREFTITLLIVVLSGWFVRAEPPEPRVGSDEMPFNPGVVRELPANSAGPIVKEKTVYSVNGPWGQLEYYVVHLMAPSHYLDMLQPETEATVWVFDNSTLEEAGQFLEEIGLGQADIPDEERSIRYSSEGPDVRLFPSGEMVKPLTPEQRTKLAKRLSGDSRNQYYEWPSIIDSGDPETWFREAGLSETNVELISSLCYRRGDVLLFSDIPYVVSLQRDAEERNRVLRAATRTRSLVVRLNVGGSGDIQDVVNYWTAGHQRKALLPILESVREVKEVERIDIAHLLPPIPRMLLYTYPGFASMAQGEMRDCHWTCRNFFSPVITAVIQDSDSRTKMLLDSLDPVDRPPEFGDTIIVYSDDDQILHSMTYIAADIVFTKNGGSVFQPWVLMHYNDVLRRYTFDKKTTVKVFRPRASS